MECISKCRGQPGTLNLIIKTYMYVRRHGQCVFSGYLRFNLWACLASDFCYDVTYYTTCVMCATVLNLLVYYAKDL